MIDESRIERERHEALATDLDRALATAPEGAAPMLVQTAAVIGAGQYGTAAVVDPGGVETEGGIGTFAASGSVIVLNAATRSATPDYWIAEAVGGRWLING